MIHPDSLFSEYFARELQCWDLAAYLSSVALNVIFTKSMLSCSLLFYLRKFSDKVIQTNSKCKSAAISSSS